MAKQVKLHSCYGSDLGVIDLDDKVFGIEPNIHVMHLALKRQLNNMHPGTASTKTRSEIRGGGRKPWRQKGTGRARAGSTRSPLFVGGGVIFGPKPHAKKLSMNKKARRLALRSSLSAKTENLLIVKDFSELQTYKTKDCDKALQSLGAQGKVLIIVDTALEINKNLILSARNLPYVKIIIPNNINVRDLLSADTIILTEDTLKSITERLT